MNIVAFFHAYKFTHFSNTKISKTQNPDKLGFQEKLKTLLLGVSNPKPINKNTPKVPYEHLTICSIKKTDCWFIPVVNSKGTVAIFHGYSGEKSSMLDKTEFFYEAGYNTLLVDFMGSGNSEGNQTTIGFYEAEQVASCFEYLKSRGEKNILLFGTSMGAAAVMKAVAEKTIHPSAIILECPFGTLLKSVQARFKIMQIPTIPMANLLVFWGGIQNNFNAFAHNPQEYAKNIKVPTLLMYGKKDRDVSAEETSCIFANLQGSKRLVEFELAGHENYLKGYKVQWSEATLDFLTNFAP